MEQGGKSMTKTNSYSDYRVKGVSSFNIIQNVGFDIDIKCLMLKLTKEYSATDFQ
jgi:hypothetical protein